jgi:hypothetical protein
MLPKSIRILGTKYKIKVVTDPENWGSCLVHDGIIEINKEALTQPNILNKTLLHEIVHATLSITGANQTIPEGTEEVICESIASVFHDLGFKLVGRAKKYSQKKPVQVKKVRHK